MNCKRNIFLIATNISRKGRKKENTDLGKIFNGVLPELYTKCNIRKWEVYKKRRKILKKKKKKRSTHRVKGGKKSPERTKKKE